MVIRVPTPAVQGAQQLGTVQAEAADTPFQTLRMPDTAFNSRILAQMGSNISQLGDYMQRQEDERLLLEFQSGLGDWERQLLYGEMPDGSPTGTGGVLGLEDQDAFGLTERTAEQFTQHLAQYNEQLSGLSRSGQLAARQYAQSTRESLLNRMAQREFQQREAYNNRLRAEAAAAAARAAETAWASPEEMAAAEARLVSSVTNRATAQYADIPDAAAREEVIRAEVAGELEQFHRTAVMRAIGSGDDDTGRRLYQEGVENGLITLQENDPLTRVVTFADQASVIVNAATVAYTMNPNDRAAAVAAVRAMGLDGDTERDTVAELEGRYASADRVEQDQMADLTERARQAAVSGTLYEDLSVVELAQLPQATVDRLNGINRGLGVVTNPVIFNTLEQMEPELLASVDLTQYMDQLSPTDYAAIASQQATLRQAFSDQAADEAARQQALRDAADFSSRQQVLTQAFSQYRITDDQQQAHITRMVEAWENSFVVQNTVAPTNEERRRFLDSLMVSVPTRTPNIFGAGERRLADVILGDDATLRFPDIPLVELTQITEALRALGMPINEDTIRATYERAQSR